VQYDEFGPTSLASPEKRLIGAIILRAIFDYRSTGPDSKRARRSAEKFLFSDNPRLSRLRWWLSFLYQNPDEQIARLRRGVLDGSIAPTKVAFGE
jgi:hypothetical protein